MPGKIARIPFNKGELNKEMLFTSSDTYASTVVASLAENTAGPLLACVYARYRNKQVSIFVQLAEPAHNDGIVTVHYRETEDDKS